MLLRSTKHYQIALRLIPSLNIFISLYRDQVFISMIQAGVSIIQMAHHIESWVFV